MSKIYEALKRAEQDREGTRLRPALQPSPFADPSAPASVAQEEYLKLRANLVTVAVPAGLHTILLTASRHGEGVTTVAIGLASALASEGESRVLLVEANLRTPSFWSVLRLPATIGIEDFAAGRVAAEAFPTRLEDRKLSVISVGEAPSPAITLEVIDSLLSRLHAQYDFIIIDAPPVNSYADTSVLSAKVDGVILVVESDRTPVVEAENAKRQLERVGVRLLGVVLNRRRSYLPAFLQRIV